MPLWAAVAIPAAAYTFRSIVRGSATPDLPADAVAFGALAIVLILAARYGATAHRSDSELPGEMDDSDHDESAER